MKSLLLGGISALCIVAVALLALPAAGSIAEKVYRLPDSPVPGMVTMVDLGAEKCVPCKLMTPILAELEKEYANRAAIVFIDILDDPDAGRKYRIQLIPTQIFYNAEGKEVVRHEGFMEKEEIVAELQKLGVR